MSDSDAEEPVEEGLNIVIEPSQMAGGWANLGAVSHSEPGFRIDFVRRDPANTNNGIVVARVAVSPLFVTQLIDTLQDNWDKFVPKTMPPELSDGD